MRSEVGVDWLTTTWAEGRLDKSLLYGTLEALYGHDWRLTMTNWASLGYVGYKAGKVSWGDRHDGHIVIATGGDAQHYVALGGPTGHNVSRLDLQATVWGDTEPDLDITKWRDVALARRGELNGRWKISHINGCGGGDTLYIGSRQSELFIRAYNKGAESGDEHYGNAIRYEVELKGERARAALDAIRGGGFAEGVILGALLACFDKRGMDFGLDALASRLDIGAPKRAPTDSERQLAWLGSQVRPTVRKLLMSHDRAILLEALGLSQEHAD